jgi:hypothetical protein
MARPQILPAPEFPEFFARSAVDENSEWSAAVRVVEKA